MLWLLSLRSLLLSLRLLNSLLRLLVLVAEPEVFALVSGWLLRLLNSPRFLSWLLNLRSLLLSLRLLNSLLRFLSWLLNLRLSLLAVVSVADVAEPQVSVDIAVAFVVLVPVSVVVVEVDSSGRPRFLAFPNVDHFASSSSSVEVVG